MTHHLPSISGFLYKLQTLSPFPIHPQTNRPMAHTFNTASNTAVNDSDTATTFSDIHLDIVQAHILNRLDGATLASAACTSAQLRSLSSQDALWSNICHSTWPSTSAQRLRHVISSFPDGPRSFFSDSFPLVPTPSPATSSSSLSPYRPPELISAVDIYFREKLIFSKVAETETVTGWFRCSPFRIDLLDPKDVVPTDIPYPNSEETCRNLAEDLTLSWIVIDPIGRRGMNLSSHKPVSVQRHWLSGEVQVCFAVVLSGERGTASEFVQCGIVVACGGSEGGKMKVREVSLQLEDMDGTHLIGRESLGILQRGLEGKRGNSGRRKGGKEKYEEYLERKRERKEWQIRTEGRLDTLCVGFGVLILAFFCMFLLCR